MANLILLFGETGSGKSRSTKSLNPDETYMIKCVDKDLPYREGRKAFSQEKKNLALTANYREICTILEKIDQTRSDIKTIIIDDIGFVMTKEFFARSTETGYNKFSDIGKHMQEIFHTLETMRKDINAVIIFHSEDVISEGTVIKKKAKTIGHLLDEKYDPISLVTICLYANVNIEKGEPKYEFITNKTLIKSAEIPAKSPEGMFEKTMANDLSEVFEKLANYYEC